MNSMRGGPAMKRLEIKKAAHSAVASILCRVKSNGATENGLSSENILASFSQAERADGGERRPSWANIPVPLRSKRCELGGLLIRQRRMTAAPAHDRAVAFSFGGVRTHGLIAPALYRSCGMMPCGKPSGLPLPLSRSANPHGVAHLLAEVSGFRQLDKGVSHE